MQKIKILKISAKLRVRTYDRITIPEIRLAGKWLKKLGFEEGNKINVELKQNKLIITIHK